MKMQTEGFVPHQSKIMAGLLASVLAGAALAAATVSGPAEDFSAMRERAQKLVKERNLAEAEKIYRELLLTPENDDGKLSDDLTQFVYCLRELNRVSEFDAVFEEAVQLHSSNWRFLKAAAAVLSNHQVPSFGYMIAGRFHRGPHRGGGKTVSSESRDRVRALQLLVAAMPLMKKDGAAKPEERADFYALLADTVGRERFSDAWKLQDLTDLTVLPDYEEGGFGGFGRGMFSVPSTAQFGRPGGGFGSRRGAPVDEEGRPVFIQLPESWEAARTDGERWRWALEQQVVELPSRRSRVDLVWAEFLRSQFGVQTLVAGPPPVIRDAGNDADEKGAEVEIEDVPGLKGVRLHELKDTETVAQLATGPRRFDLPDEFNHVLILQRVAARKDGQQREALEALVSVRMSREQFPQAADLYRQILKLATDKRDKQQLQDRINQIEGRWVRFESVNVQPVGIRPTFEIRYRNGSLISFEARPVRIDALLKGVREYLESHPDRVEYQKTQIAQVGMQVIQGDRDRLLGPVAAEWKEKLNPSKLHFDRIRTVEVPLTKPGAWFVTGKMKNGNEARMVIWVMDTAITRKRVERGTLYYVADAVTGRPVAAADLEFFGWRQERIDRTSKYRVLTQRFAERTSDDGLCVPDGSRLQRGFQWLAIARTKDGRLAYDGFHGVWLQQKLSPLNYSPVKVYTVTDRPVYRPQHAVKYRLWVRRPRFSRDDAEFAGHRFAVQIRNPRGDIVADFDATTDRWAGIDGEWVVPADAVLGRYQILIGTRYSQQRTRQRNGRTETYTVKGVRRLGYGSFRVEEYRKPEFEVKVEAPEKPVQLGEKIQARITAKYYFGAPVTNAKVHYKVERTKKDARWYPAAAWDWLYSPGYWWFSPDYDWYPGWRSWGCPAPIPIWRGWNPDPPELVAEGDAEIGADGTFNVDIDTAPALAEHSDSDHNYKITAEVTDASRRTIHGSGDVLVARDPFRVYVWPDRGHYRTGDTVNIGAQARTPDGRPVVGDAVIRLLALSYDGETPRENVVEEWRSRTDDGGRVSQKFVVPAPGQFRISVKVTDKDGHQMEGGYLLFVRGPEIDTRNYRFNALELITDQKEYQPGDTVRLQINTDAADSTVLLFLRPMNGLCPDPIVLRLDGKSTVYEIPVTRDDLPNFFVEAVTIASGRIHSEVREIVVPPEKKVANVEVLPSSEKLRPGEEVTVRLRLTDLHGRPFRGNTVLSVYDASLEYIAASSIPEIRSFFWNVRRRHSITLQSTLQWQTGPVYYPNEKIMQLLAAEPVWGIGSGYGVGGLGGGVFGGALGAPAARGAVMAPMMAADAAPMEAADMSGAVRMRKSSSAAAAGGAAQGQEPAVRSEFADTAYWLASAESDADGIVEVRFKVPDNLTTWTIKAWALGEGTRVGAGSAQIVVSKDLIIRPQTPRFFTETDLVTLSAVIHNYHPQAVNCRVVLETEGGQLQILENSEQPVRVPAGGETRVDWNVHAVASGTATVRMLALSEVDSDAAELSVPVQVHGMLKTDSYTGVVRPDADDAAVSFRIPAQRIEEQSRLEVRFSPTLAGAMVDALPYLIEYPYGCTEQTLNRFLPAAITQQTLIRMGIDLEDVRKKRTNLNAQEIGDPQQRAAQWKRYDRNPVFDTAELNRIIRKGVTDLSNMQLSDGGWGWFSGYGEHSSPHLTAQVVHGLTVAQKNDVPVLADVIQKGVAWLKAYQAEELEKLREGDRRRDNPEKAAKRRRPYKMNADNMDALVAFVLSEHDGSDPAMVDYLYRDRGQLSVYGMALTGLVLHAQQDQPRTAMILRNIEQFLVTDDENQTAYLNIPQHTWWYWYGSDNEAMARYLQLLLQTDPDSSVAPRLVKYLLNNRKHGTYWRSTRDTALVVEAFADYLQATGEDRPDMTVRVLLDGQLQKRVRITAENLFSFDNVVLLQGDVVRTGDHRLQIVREGRGPVYFNAYVTNFTKEDPITAAGLEVKVSRQFYLLQRDDREVSVRGDRGHVVRQQTVRYKRVPLQNLASVRSGDLLEVEMLIESKNDYEYLMLEDFKPSGFEMDDQRSGYVFEGLHAYREIRDNRVSFFLSDLARGQHSISYRIRAEMPGQRMSALPAKIQGMYAPELVGNSDEFKIRVEDTE